MVKDVNLNNKKCQIFILFGQSNAVGHGIPMLEKDKIKTPLKNVFGLHRKYNQSFDIKKLTWSGYTSSGMNLAEEQDDTYSVANCLATLWQKEIDDGKDLPDLYIVQIAIGAQGVSEQYLSNGETKKYMWNPDYEKKLVAGKLGTVDISLYPFSLHILSLLDDSFKAIGKEYEIMNLLWRGGENDVETPVENLKGRLKGIYEEMFSGFYKAIGYEIPITLNKIVCHECFTNDYPSGEPIKSLNYINEIFNELAKENDNISVFDTCKAPFYKENESGNGLFIDDLIHYTPETNRWNAEEIIKKYIKSLCH